MKTRILFGDNLFKATWQDKSFKDIMAALEFVRKHSDKVQGINGEIIPEYAKPLNHFDIMTLLEGKTL